MDFINFIDKNLDEMSRKMADMDDCPAETDGTRSLAMACSVAALGQHI